MSRRDYIAIAEILRDVPMTSETRAQLVARFVTALADDNPRFSPTRFREACEPTTTAYVVVENTPGYLPEDDDPPTFENYADAVEYLKERTAEYAEDPDGNYELEYGIASGDNYAAVIVHDRDKTHDLGRVIEILHDEETR